MVIELPKRKLIARNLKQQSQKLEFQNIELKESKEELTAQNEELITYHDEINLKHIFDPFFTTKDPGKATGLGLSISKRIILEHNGTIQCESMLQKGTTFVIQLPIITE